MTTPPPAANRGWLVLSAAVGINLILGSLYAWGVIAKVLADPKGPWHWNKTDAALPFTVSTAAFALTMIFAGRAQDKIGPRWVAMLGGAMFGLGLFLSAFATTPLLMMLTYGLAGGIGIGLCYSATTPPVIKWFPPGKKGVITGIVVSGVGLAAVYVSPLTQLLLEQTGVSHTFMILGVGAIILILLFTQLLANPPPGYVASAATSAPAGTAAPARPAAGPRVELDWHEMLRQRRFYLLWAMFVLAASAGLMIIAHVAIIAKEQAGWKWGFVPIATLAIFNTLGRVVSGFLSDRFGRPRTMALAFLLQALNMCLFSYYTTPELVVFGAAFAGLCYGTIFTLMPAATADFYGVRNLGVNYGLLFTAFGVAGITGPLLGGRVRDLCGTYGPSYAISACMLLVAAVLAMLSSTARPKDSRTAGLG